MNLKRKHRRGETRVARRQRYIRNNVRFLPEASANDRIFRQPKRPGWKMAALAALFGDRNVRNRFIPPLASSQSHEKSGNLLQRPLYQGVLDKRRFYLGGISPVARIGPRPDTELEPVNRVNVGLSHLAFAVPHSVLTCVRRKQRKQVLFATGKAGKSGQKKPKWNEESYIRC